MLGIPPFIRIRELAKLLKADPKKLVQDLCVKKNRVYSFPYNGQMYKFPKLKSVIIPRDATMSYISQRFPSFETFPTESDPVVPDNSKGDFVRNPVLAVLGHVNHGKTSLLDTLRDCGDPSSIVESEVASITQTINVGETSSVTILDTPGHFHFYRMRNSAAALADIIVLVVAANEGVCQQTQEALGIIEEIKENETSSPSVVVVINKVDLVPHSVVNDVWSELQTFKALEHVKTFVRLVATDASSFTDFHNTISDIVSNDLVPTGKLSTKRTAECFGIALEIRNEKGMGHVLRILVKTGTFKLRDAFVCGLNFGLIRRINTMDGKSTEEVVPGRVYDIVYSNQSRHSDAPLEVGFHTVRSIKEAQKIVDAREMALDFESCVERNVVAEEEDNDEDHDDLPVTPVIIKAESAGSLVTLLDTLQEEGSGVYVSYFGIGDVTDTDLTVANGSDVPIYCYGVRMRHKQAKRAKVEGVTVRCFDTVPELLYEITTQCGDK